MSSSLINFTGAVNVSNMMFWRVHEFALQIAKEKESIPGEALKKFANFKEEFGYTPDIDIDEIFSKEELKFWADVFGDLADRIFNRKIGIQDNQEWQVWTIWTVCSISKLFYSSFRFINKVNESDPNWIEQKQRNLAEVCLRNDDTEQAIIHLNKALEHNPDSAITIFMLGLTYKKMGLLEKGKALMAKSEGIIQWFEKY